MSKEDNALRWYERALETGDDSEAQFMKLWIAFNSLYDKHRKRNEDKTWNTERERIVLLCEERNKDLIGYDPFTEDRKAMQKLADLPVLSGWRVPNNRCRPRLPLDSIEPQEMSPYELWGVVCLGHGFKRVQCLLLTLYQVRCNLFHGSKDPDLRRDQELVDSAARIMQRYMGTLLHVVPPSKQSAR